MSNPLSVQETTTATSNLGTTYTVTNTNDDGEGSLRWAITQSNDNPGTDTILFNIEDGYYTITPLSALPEITSPVLIDATSQPGYEGTPIIQISGYQAGEGLSGLVISAGDSTVRGLIITQFSSYGLRLIAQGNNIIQGNYIGNVEYIYEGFSGNGEGGILIESANNLIGGATTSERNIVSGNTGTGVLINNETAINNQVINNYIGLDSSGTSSRPNGVGVEIVNGSDNLIQENVIAGNTNSGVSVLSYGAIANNNQILSNWIGTSSQGYYFLGNGDDGIDLAGAKNTLVQGNNIYYNQSTGVVIRGADATGNKIEDNNLFNNTAEGVSIQEEAQGNSITGNTINYNNSNGISVDNSQKNTIQGNGIYENRGLGIDLGRDGVTVNDEGDSDTGANALQNYPVFTSAEVVAGTATLIGYLDSEANKEYRIEIFANRTQDPSGNGEGEDYRTYITVTTDDNGRADFILSLPNAERLYSYITGTATNPDGNTSEFSPSITLTGELPNLVITEATAPTNVGSGQSFTVNWTGKNDGSLTTGSSYWYDRVVFSTNDIYGDSDDIALISYQYISSSNGLPLEPNETYTASSTVTLPSYVAGSGYLLFKTDAYDYQVEFNENDNVYAQAINIASPNLIISNVTAPTNATAGQTITLSWTGKNDGSVTTGSSYWYDRVVFSKNQIFGDSDDVYLTEPYIYSYYGLPLEPNETYTVNTSVTLPGGAVGSGYLLFKTDAYNYQVEANENDNVYAQAIDIASPNLIISNVTAPTTATAGQTITLSWTGKNDGSVTTASSLWYDRVVFSKNDIYGDSDDIYVTEQFISSSNGLPLEPNETYTVSRTVTLPSSAAVGNSYLLVRTDVYNYQVESNENDNVYAQAISIGIPNLTITNVTAPTNATAGQSITLSWTGKNDGSGTTVSSNWYDRVVFSKNDIYGDSDDIYLTERYISSSNGLPLEPNETYTVSSTVTLPSSVVSNGYLLVRTDVYNYQTESNENDNVYIQAIDITAPNLIITNFTAPSTASTRQTIAVSWTVQNQGTGVTNTSSWNDRIVFSSDTVFGNGDDIYLTEISASTFANLPLDPDEAYNVTQNITLPDTVAGNGYLLVKTDNYNGQLESNKTDNIRSVAIAVNAPNLVISNPTSPPSAAILGQTIPLSWRVTNTGTVSALAGWYDRVYLSNDGLLDSNDVNIIGEFYRPNSLAPNASYTNNQNIFLPATSIGDRYLLFVTDVYRGQGETNETDNIIATPITLTAPDLTVTAATAPTTAVTSGTLNVSWTVTNGGDVVASADWSDEVRLSTNTIWGDSDDRSIISGTVSIAAQTPLNPNSSYTIERTVTLPSVAAGNYHLLFRADRSNQQGETNEENNVRSLPIAIAVPDLVVSAAAAPTNGIASQSIAVSWTVTNQGTVDAAADWYDSVYLSTNNTFEGFNDSWIASDLISTQTPLLAGNSYTFTRNVTLPNRPAGDYFLLFLADDAYRWGNSQRETDENNNVRAVPITIGVPDLTVSAATAPSSGVLGGAIDVSWTVTNTSTVTAPADWSDRIYFSTDEVWNPSSDTLITSEAIATQTPLNAGLSYTVNRTITLPNVASSGSGYLLFVADGNANQAESNENNNVRSVPFTLNAPNLTVTGATAPSSVSLGSTIAVTWTVANSGQFPANANWYDSVYLSDNETFETSDVWLGERWSGNSQPIAVGGTYTGTRNITLPTTTTGNRYLLFITDQYANYSTTFNNRQGETNENDNVFALPINISSADLVLESAIAPSGGIIGNPITLSWTVKNQGTGEAPQDWRDYVYLSLNQTLDGSDTLLVNEAIATQTPLAADGSYTINKTVNLASITPGTRYLIFVADGSGNQGEINETNNQRVVEIVVTAPDLIVSTANAPTTAITGSNIAVSWTTTNQGTSEASADWSDAVYLSGDSLFDGSDIFITSEAIASQTPLAAGASYTISRNIALPSNVSGDRFLLFVADNSNAQGEVDNTNNVRAVPIGINASAILSFSAATFRVNEDGMAIAPVTIERSGIITESVSVTLNLSNGTAIAGSDYNSSPLTVTFAPGETSKTVTIPIVNDTRFEPEETVNLTLANPSAGAVIGVQNTAVLTIVSDDLPVYGKLSFSNAQFTVREDGGAIVAVTVSRTEGSDGNVGATINLTNGTAIAPGDYNNASVTVNFTPGETSKTIVIPIVNDAIYEPDETINLTLTNPTGGATLGSQTTATLTILDNDPPQQGILAFSQSSYSINENGTAVTQVTVMRSGGSDGEVSATINLFNGSATAPSDYNSSPIIVNFANGETSKTVVIPIVNDTVYEANETINLTLSNPTGGAIIRGQNTAVVTIVDDDIELNFSSRTYNAGENGVPAAQVTVNRAGITSVPVGVTLLLRNGTATAPDDYLDTPITVTFAPGETSKTVTLPIVDDEQLEANETILLSLTDPTNGATLGSQATASLTIASDDLPDLVVSNIVAPLDARSGGAIDVTWRVTNQGNITASGTWVDYVYLSENGALGNDQFLGSFSFTGTLAPGASIDRTQTVTLPLATNGDRWIVVMTDANNAIKERPGTENNNSRIDDRPINVSLSPYPNLQVASVTAPTTAFSSQETVIKWVVTNTGNGNTNTPLWYDRVWLSLDQTLDSSDIYLGQAANSSYLNVGESYSNTLNVTLPLGIDSNYYFLVQADGTNQVWEFDREGDNITASNVTDVDLTPPPDLQIASVIVPASIFSGQKINLNWTVENRGAGKTFGRYWYDDIYLSLDQTIDTRTDYYLGRQQYNSFAVFDSGASYTVSKEVELPVGISGNYYFLVRTDAGNYVFEQAFKENNTGSTANPVNIRLTPPPDLEVDFVDAPASATASRPLTFNYRVTNYGSTRTPNNSWSDSFYLSTDNKLDIATDYKLGDRSRFGALNVDEFYTASATFSLPNTLTGTFYLFAIADSSNQVFELDNNNNSNFDSQVITITSRPADLIVSGNTSQSIVENGKSLRVNWTTTNQGIGDTAVNSWSDRVIISRDNILGNNDDVVLARNDGFNTRDFIQNSLLNVGGSYSRSELLTIPFNFTSGDYHLFVVTDANQNVYEASGENNNSSAAIPIQVVRRTPDLQVTQITAPSTAVSGQPFTVTWKVENLGENATNFSYWYDEVFLSTDAILNQGDLSLGTIYQARNLDPAGSHQTSRTFTLPADIQGNYYVLVSTDIYNHITEDALENNNIGVAVTPSNIALSQVPDLVVNNLVTPTQAISGQSLELTWTVKNEGFNSSGSWRDYFYLSRDRFFDPANDIYIGFVGDREGLNSGQAYTKTNQFNVPRGLTGDYYLIAITDATNTVYEREGENNNIFITNEPIPIVAAVPTDLVAGTITIPANGTPGRSATITYTVDNQGIESAIGNWQDSIYISADDKWDINDLLFSQVNVSGPLNSGSSYSRTVTANLPGAATGNYHVIVRSDIRNVIPESNDINNLKASLDQFALDVERLILGTPVEGTLDNRQSVYYKVEVSAGETLKLKLDGNIQPALPQSTPSFSFRTLTPGYVNTELYVRYGDTPSSTQFDYRFTQPLFSDQEITIPSTQAGSYYVLAYASEVQPWLADYQVNNLSGSEGNLISGGGAIGGGLVSFPITISLTPSYSLKAEIIDFSIQDISTKKGSNRGQVTMAIEGAKFTPDGEISLIANDGTTRAASKVWWKDTTEMWATFDLRGLATGLYDVRLEDGSKIALANDIFTVTDGVVGKLETQLMAPAALRPGETGVIVINYANTGETDIVAPLLTLGADNANFTLPNEGGAGNPSIQILGIDETGPAGILSPGETGGFSVRFVPTVTANIVNFSLSQASETETVDWSDLKAETRPAHVSSEAWDAIWQNFTNSVGTTTGSYQATLAENANSLSQLGNYVHDVNSLLAFELQQSSNSIVGTGWDGSLEDRLIVGPFGRGGSSPWEINLTNTNGDVTILYGNTPRLFSVEPDGSYRASVGDHGTLTVSEGIYRLREEDGTLTVFRADGKFNYIEDTNGIRLTASYGDGRLTRLESTWGNSLAFSYNAQGRISQVTEEDGQTSNYEYDATGQYLLSVTTPEGTTRYTYYDASAAVGSQQAIKSVTFSDNSTLAFVYDSQGRVTQESWNNGARVTNYQYDATGGVTVTDAIGSQTQMLFNEFGLMGRLEDPLDRLTRFQYDSDGNLTSLIAPDNTASVFTYDQKGNVLTSRNALGQQVKFAYEPTFNQLTSVQDQKGNPLSYSYDNKGNLTGITYADGSQETFSRDAFGNVSLSTNRRGQPIEYTYNSRGLLTRKQYTDGTFAAFTYDGRGNLLSAIDADSSVSYSYDNADRLTKVTYGVGRYVEYSYDNAGRRTRMANGDGLVVNYGYDDLGQLSQLTDGNGGTIITYTYDAIGRLTREDNGNGTYTTYNYDAAGQLLSLVNYKADNTVNSRYDYTYDVMGRRTSMTTLEGTTNYTYDAIGQLTGVSLPNGRTIQYRYDAAGNRIAVTDSGVATNYSTNNLNQYTSAGGATFTYDTDGNLIRKQDGSRTWDYSYDSENRLVGVNSGSDAWIYEYDAIGNRIATIYNGQRTEYLVDPTGLGDVVGEYNGTGSLIASYTHGLGLVSRFDGSGASYYDADAIGSIVGLTGNSGTYLNQYSYLPFGEDLSKSETVSNPFEYVGQWGVMDEGNGLDFMRARYYDSSTGKFTSPDPIGILGGFNLYKYANNGPLIFIDPSGESPSDWVRTVRRLVKPEDHGIGGKAKLFPELDIGTHIRNLGKLEHVHWKDLHIIIDPKYYEAAFPGIGGNATYAARVAAAAARWWGAAGLVYGAWEAGWWIGTKMNDAYGDHYARWLKPVFDVITRIIRPSDPNDIVGPDGFGEENWLLSTSTLPYTIRFENQATATAPAQVVTITHPLDSDLDLRTFRLGDFGWSGLTFDVPDNVAFYSQRLDLTATKGFLVDVAAGIDIASKQAFWTLTTIDPNTGEIPQDPSIGFLPPNNDTGIGDGFVNYTIRPGRNVTTGTVIDAQATIVFDNEAPIDTPPIFNTLDAGKPSSQVESLANTVDTSDFLVKWTGNDDENGSGIASFDVYVSENGGNFTLWLDNTTLTEASYRGQPGKSYAF
ncbi:MAG: right-handed parallel beta-helix repeat-containing protein, partial [Microcystis sp. LE19-338.1B]|nr:right-handed parallel beta-helix repeat-containing protein [Microcystis sp. LE19-338.1B]